MSGSAGWKMITWNEYWICKEAFFSMLRFRLSHVGVRMWKKVNELENHECSLLLDKVYIFGIIFALEQQKFYFKQQCIWNLNVLRWSSQRQLRLTIHSYFAFHLNTLNVTTLFKKNINLQGGGKLPCCDILDYKQKATSPK